MAVAFAFPVYGLALLALAVPYGDALRLPVGGLSLTASELALGILVFAWVARSATQRAFVLDRPIVWAPLGAVLAVASWSAAAAPDISLAAKELVKWVEFGLAMTLAVQLTDTAEARKGAVIAVLVVGASQALYGLYQAGVGAGPGGFLLAGTLRAFGTFAQPNPFAIYLASGLCLGIGIGLTMLRQGLREFLTPLGALLLACSFVLAAAILASYSRSAWIALAVAGAVMVGIQGRRTALLGASALFLLVILGISGASDLLPTAITSRLSVLSESISLFDPRDAVLTSENFAVVHRMAIWQAAWGMFLDHPFFGVGAGNFDVWYASYALPHWPEPPGHAHNYFLNLLAEQGVAGLAAYLILLGAIAALLVRTLLTLRDEHGEDAWLKRGLVISAIGVLALVTVQHAFDNLYVHSIGIQIGLLLGLGLGAQRRLEGPA